jgi:energy-coupling factor transport system permease protein
LAETNNGPYHPTCYNNASGKHELAKLTFLVTNDRTFECMFAPIKFYWLDCGDNTISSKYGDTLWIVSRVFEFEGFEGPLHEITDHVAPPSFTGIDSSCLIGDKVVPVRLIDFRDGGVDIVCGGDIDARGDINVNGLPYEIADAVMFTNYFISGLMAFGTHAEASIAASDANADGVALSVADLVYLIRVVVGDASPYPKPISGSETITLNTQVLDNQMTVSYDASTDAGAALLMRNPWYLIALAGIALIVAWRLTGEPPGRGTFYLVGALILTSTVVNLLFSRAGDTVILQLPIPWLGGPYTLEALLFGVSAGIQVATLLLVMGVFARALTAADLLRRTPRGLYTVGVASTLGLSFAPHARQALFDLREAQQLRGLSAGGWRDSPRLLTPLVVVALERATAQAEALAARGWAVAAPSGHRRWEGALAWTAIAASFLLCAAAPDRAGLAAILAAVAVGAHWIARRRGETLTRYRPDPWHARDTFVAGFAVGAIAAIAVLASQDPASLGYYPYPTAYLPPLALEPLVAVACLAAPATVV